MGPSFPPSVRVLGSAVATAICSERNCSGVMLAGPESRPHSLEIALPNLVEARIAPSASYGLVYCSKGVGLTGPLTRASQSKSIAAALAGRSTEILKRARPLGE